MHIFCVAYFLQIYVNYYSLSNWKFAMSMHGCTWLLLLIVNDLLLIQKNQECNSWRHWMQFLCFLLNMTKPNDDLSGPRVWGYHNWRSGYSGTSEPPIAAPGIMSKKKGQVVLNCICSKTMSIVSLQYQFVLEAPAHLETSGTPTWPNARLRLGDGPWQSLAQWTHASSSWQ